MNKLILVLAISAALLVPAEAQIGAAPPPASPLKIGGYFSADFYLGQPESGYSNGSFENPAGGVFLAADWTPNFGARLEFSLAQGARVEILQALAELRASAAFQLKVGLFLVPFGRYNESRRPFETGLVLDPYPVGDLFPASWRDLGAVLSGRLGRFEYAAFIGNGLGEAESPAGGQQFRDNNEDKGWGGRIGYALSQNLALGGSYYRGKIDAANARRETLWGYDAVWQSESFRLTGEYVKAEVENPAPYPQGSGEGFFGLLTFRLGRVSPVVAYESISYEDPFHGPGFGGPETPGEGIARDRTRWSLGFVYMPYPGIRLKLEYDLNREPEPQIRDNVLRIQIAVHF
jgi:hypothetical protein